MQKIWEWLNGNKTLIGTLILALVGSGFVPEHTFLFDFLSWLGAGLAAGGVFHKVVKGTNNT